MTTAFSALAPALAPALVAEEAHHDLPMAPIAYSVIAFCGFLLALGVLWAFRNTAAKIGGGDVAAHHATAGGGQAAGGHDGGHH